MAHHIIPSLEVLEVVHTGTVGYDERLAALDDVSKAHALNPLVPVLINFADATLALEKRADQHCPARADYVAQATVHVFFTERCVAMVGASYEAARPVIAAAFSRRVPFRLFDSREDALAWLNKAADSRRRSS